MTYGVPFTTSQPCMLAFSGPSDGLILETRSAQVQDPDAFHHGDLRESRGAG